MPRVLRLVGALVLVAAMQQSAGARPLPAKAKAKGPPAAKKAAAGKKAAPPTRPPAPARAEDLARLGRGHARFLDGDWAGALKELAPLATAPRLQSRDYALYLIGQCEALAGRHEAALGRFRTVAAMQQSRLAPVAAARAADMAWALGRWKEARQGYEMVLRAKSPSPDVEPAVARYRLAELAARDGRHAVAQAGWRTVFVEHPAHPLADRGLDRLRAARPGYVVDVRDRVARARRLSAERQWQRALDELALVPADAPREVRAEADYWIGTTAYKSRHGYQLAAEKLLDVAERLDGDRRTDALFHGARAWSRVDQDDRAIAGYRALVEKYPRSRQAPEAAFLVGWLEYNRGRFKEAIPPLEAMLKKYGDSQWADDARWYLGFSRWLMGDVAGALAEFERLGRQYGGSGAYVAGKGRYWQGRALAKLGREGEAIAVWRQIVSDYPLSYYALQARARLRALKVDPGPFGRARPDGANGSVQAASQGTGNGSSGSQAAVSIGAVDPQLAADPALARVDELLAAGLAVEAGAELDRADGTLLARHGAARALPALFDRYHRAANWFRTHRLAEAHGGNTLRLDPHDTDADRARVTTAWWREIYPLAYQSFIEKYGPTGKNPTYYLYTIMQKESAYNPHDVSYADAIGLLQMIPPTSRRVGERIGRPYTDDVLYDPEGNIQFGAWYIGHLLEKFKGQVALGAGSYNAGPKAMMRWIKLHGARPLDEFIELCAYNQTREYMKKALDIYAHYLYLYERKEYLPDERIDAEWLDDGIEY